MGLELPCDITGLKKNRPRDQDGVEEVESDLAVFHKMSGTLKCLWIVFPDTGKEQAEHCADMVLICRTIFQICESLLILLKLKEEGNDEFGLELCHVHST